MIREVKHVSGERQIAFIGNERELIHAMRAILRYHYYCHESQRQYKFFLFGNFPRETLAGIKFNAQWIGDRREQAVDFQDHYHLILDAETQYSAKSGLSLSQWFEERLGLRPEDKAAPFFSPKAIPLKMLMEYRQRTAMHGVGNTVMFVPPSPHDPEWHNVSMRGNKLHAWLTYLLHRKFSIICPQVRISDGVQDEAYDHRFYYSGYEDDFFEFCLTPDIRNIQDFLFNLLHCRYYVGWNNWLADLAAAAHIPSLIFWTSRWEHSRYYHPTTEYVRIFHSVPEPEHWHEDHFNQKFRSLEARVRPVH